MAVLDQARIDKERETAKNYLVPFLPTQGKNIINIEFAEIVETSAEFLKITTGLNATSHMDRWKSINHFLYNNEIWNSTPPLYLAIMSAKFEAIRAIYVRAHSHHRNKKYYSYM